MKVFLSWSGEPSHQVACVLKDWLPSVIQSLRPYVSSQDIDKGARWSTDIAKELQESTFGILCVTRANMDAPWINFEAGALSKTIDKGSVAPFLFDVKRSEVQGPLLQFQSTVNEKTDVLKLLVSLNGAMDDQGRLEEGSLKKSFEVWWPELERLLGEIPTPADVAKTREEPKPSHMEAILEEILELTRTQQRLLRSPEELLPPQYVEFVLSRTHREDPQLTEVSHLVRMMRTLVERYISQAAHLGNSGPNGAIEGIERMVTEMGDMLSHTDALLRRSMDKGSASRSREAARARQLGSLSVPLREDEIKL